MQDNETRIHETVKCVYPWETPKDMVCEYVRAVVGNNYLKLTVEEEMCNHDHSKTGLRNRQRVDGTLRVSQRRL